MPRAGSGEFVAALEDVLNVYQRPYDPKRPHICLDETTKALMSTVHNAVPMEPGQPVRPACEYKRHGTWSIFLACEPLTGRCVVQVSSQHPRLDWAHFVNRLLEEEYSKAEKVLLVMDDLITHTTGSLYEAFPPEKASTLAARLEIHYTPKHARSSPCLLFLKRRIDTQHCTNVLTSRLSSSRSSINNSGERYLSSNCTSSCDTC